MKNKNLVKNVFTIIFSALLILPTFVAWISVTAKNKLTSSSEGIFFGDLSEKILEFTESGWAYQASEIIFWIAFSIAMLLIVLSIMSILLPKMGLLRLLIKVAGLALIFASIAAFAGATIWCIANSSSNETLSSSISYYPLWGSAITLVAGLLGGAFALSLKKK